MAFTLSVDNPLLCVPHWHGWSFHRGAACLQPGWTLLTLDPLMQVRTKGTVRHVCTCILACDWFEHFFISPGLPRSSLILWMHLLFPFLCEISLWVVWRLVPATRIFSHPQPPCIMCVTDRCRHALMIGSTNWWSLPCFGSRARDWLVCCHFNRGYHEEKNRNAKMLRARY